MAIKSGTKLINFWGNIDQIDKFQKKAKTLGFYPSRLMWIFIDMWMEDLLDEQEIAKRHQKRGEELRINRIKRIMPGYKEND